MCFLSLQLEASLYAVKRLQGHRETEKNDGKRERELYVCVCRRLPLGPREIILMNARCFDLLGIRLLDVYVDVCLFVSAYTSRAAKLAWFCAASEPACLVFPWAE